MSAKIMEVTEPYQIEPGDVWLMAARVDVSDEIKKVVAQTVIKPHLAHLDHRLLAKEELSRIIDHAVSRAE